MRFNDAVFGALLLLGATGLFIVAHGFPAMPGQSFGPALFPRMIATGFALTGAGLLWSGLRQPAFAGVMALGDWARSGGRLVDVGLVVGGIAVLILLWDRLGFLIVATLLTGGLMGRFREGRWLSSFAGALAACIVIDWIFRRLLLVPLPLGPLTGIVW